MRKKVDAKIRAFILRKRKNFLHLGVRQIAGLATIKFKTNVSKSTVCNILKSKGLRSKKGRKLAYLTYKKDELNSAGLFLLKALDSEINLFESCVNQLKGFLSDIDPKQLKKILVFLSFCAFLNKDWQKVSNDRGLLRLSGLYTIPKRKTKKVLEVLKENKPHLDLSSLKSIEKSVTKLKFTFENQTTSFCDPGMVTFWDETGPINKFFLPFSAAKKKLERMLAAKTILINYTKSYDYLSSHCYDFVNGISNGIKKIEFLGLKDEVLEGLVLGGLKPDFILGYYPKIFSRGASFVKKPKRIMRLSLITGDLWYIKGACRFSRLASSSSKGLQFFNIVVSKKLKFSPTWAMMTSKREKTQDFLKKYIYLWPAQEKGFIEDMTAIERVFLKPQASLSQPLYPLTSLIVEDFKDLAELAKVLLSIFKTRWIEAKIDSMPGFAVQGKDFYKIALKKSSAELRDKINRACLYIDEKRLFLV